MRKSDIIIIGSGPAGMEVAVRAVASGRDTVIIERDLLGGTCLNPRVVAVSRSCTYCPRSFSLRGRCRRMHTVLVEGIGA